MKSFSLTIGLFCRLLRRATCHDNYTAGSCPGTKNRIAAEPRIAAEEISLRTGNFCVKKLGSFVCVLGLLSTAVSLPAQDLSSLAPKAPWFQCFFAKMCPNTPEFSANGRMNLCNSEGVTQFVLPMDMAVSTNCSRWEVDVGKIWPLPAQFQVAAKAMHMDKMVFLTRMDQKRVYMVYPGIQAYVTLPIPESALVEYHAKSGSVRMEKTALAKEIVSGHPCVKTKVVDAEPGQPPEEGLMWCATDLQNFPVKMELHAARNVMKFDFPDVHIGKPAASLFAVPASYAAFTNSADLMHYAKEKFQENLKPKSQ